MEKANKSQATSKELISKDPKVIAARNKSIAASNKATAASKKATAATGRYNKSGNEGDKTAAEKAIKNANETNENIKKSSPEFYAQNKTTLDANQEVINNRSLNSEETGDEEGDGAVEMTTYNSNSESVLEKNGAATDALGKAKASQAKAEGMQNNIYVRGNFSTSQNAMQVYQNALQRNMIISTLGEQTSNLIGAGFQEQAKDDEGNAQIQNAYSQAFQQAITSTTQAMQALYTLAGDLRSSSNSVAGDMSSMVSSTRA